MTTMTLSSWRTWRQVAMLVVSLGPLVCQAGGRFWHITDLHLDYAYSTFGNATNMCHKNDVSPSNTSTLGPVGNYSCDAPEVLIDSLLQAMYKIEPNPDFIVWTGDSAPHLYNPEPTLPYITNVTSWVFSRLNSLFPNIPIIPALGNHDSSPVDSYPESNDTESQETQYYKYYHDGGFGGQLEDVPGAKETFLKCGYYSKTVTNAKNATLKFLSLNTNVYYYNKARVSQDPCDQLAWINQTIKGLAENEKVYILAHVPPGSFERSPGISFFNYNNTVNDIKLSESLEKDYVSLLVHQDVYKHVHAHLYGHAHTDSFRLYLSRSGDETVLGVGFLASSGTPLVGHGEGTNPAIRLFHYDEEDGTLLDYEQYGLKLEDLNLNMPEQKPEDQEADAARKRREVNETTTSASDTVETTTEEQANDTTEDPAVTTQQSLNNSIGSNNNSKPLLGHKGENPTPGNVSLLGHEGENPTPGNVTSLGHKGENPTPEDNMVKPSALVDAVSSKFILIYKASEAYKVDNLTASEMGRAYNKMNKGSLMFSLYYKHNTVNHTNGRGLCNEQCYRNHMCTIKHSIISELNACIADKTSESLHVNIEVDDWSSDPSIVVTKSPIPAPTAPSTTPTPPSTTSKPTPATATPTTDAPTTATKVTRRPVIQPPRPAVPTHARSPKFPPSINSPSIDTQPKIEVEPTSEGGAQIAAVVLGAAGVVLLLAICGIAMRKYRQRRYRDQEFLLTDSVFRYDGYNQLDDDY